jgi:hypothetical protein
VNSWRANPNVLSAELMVLIELMNIVIHGWVHGGARHTHTTCVRTIAD